MNNFDTATSAANALVRELLDTGIPADDVADALITQALAGWAAATDRLSDAKALLATWAAVRDADASH
ncbi:hypothetical protein [Aminobacter sp. SS-2016]|uniref:hypothetical protein n=1 Tax=Aminobacter sp. Y103A TaxID=1870862 RepID=UPI0025747472|nr:hypothetical protein [Aminobacter sp. SS-2016]